jgi:ATP-dependent Clp protease ATP-binding subunit ClpA
MTSNIGSELIFEKSSFGFVKGEESTVKYEDLKDDVLALLRKGFKPEFLNRVDDVVIFKSLGQEEIRQIAGLELEKLSGLMGEQGIRLEVSDGARRWLAKEGFDQKLGARPLKRLIQTQVENPISGKMIAGEVGEGDEVKVDVSKGELLFELASDKVRVEA